VNLLRDSGLKVVKFRTGQLYKGLIPCISNSCVAAYFEWWIHRWHHKWSVGHCVKGNVLRCLKIISHFTKLWY